MAGGIELRMKEGRDQIEGRSGWHAKLAALRQSWGTRWRQRAEGSRPAAAAGKVMAGSDSWAKAKEGCVTRKDAVFTNPK